jgi:hypothetical protein
VTANPAQCSVLTCTQPIRARGWCGTHWSRWRRTGDVGADQPPKTRRQIDYDDWTDLVAVDGIGCWIWTGYVISSGYGQFGKRTRAHRYVYELLVGPIPDGLILDHLCRVRRCVNPDHLEPVTMAENTRRGYSPWSKRSRQRYCKRGHPLAGSNLSQGGRGTRRCLACHREGERRRRARRCAEDVSA